MTRKKSGFLTFIFSLLPGAGEMYMGFMKQGVTLMGLFFLVIFMASWFHLGPLLFTLPIIWFYGFFHVHSLRGMPDDEFYALEDDYLFHLDQILPKNNEYNKKYHNVFAAVLIVIGGAILLNNLNSLVRWLLPSYLMDWYWSLTNTIPQLVLAVLLIGFGIWLIRGKKKELDSQEEGKDGGQL